MNGSHDVGGMHGFGEVDWERGVPPALERWEAAMIACNRALGTVIPNIDAFRYAIERMGNAAYLDTSYFEHWLAGAIYRATQSGLISEDELAAREALAEREPAGLPMSARTDVVPPPPAPAPLGHRYCRELPNPPRFAAGDRVRTRNINPSGHTRLSRYARNHVGTVDRLHGGMVFPDTNAHGLGENPQHLYTVRFEARELWGEDADEREAVYIDLWESYLEADG